MLCPTCNDEMRQVPAGVSKKTGKPYRAFFACDKPACKDAKQQRSYQSPSQQLPQSCNCEETIAKIRIAFADLNKRLTGLETLVESLSSKEAKDFHQGFPVKDDIPVINPVVQEAADILGGKVMLDKAPW